MFALSESRHSLFLFQCQGLRLVIVPGFKTQHVHDYAVGGDPEVQRLEFLIIEELAYILWLRTQKSAPLPSSYGQCFCSFCAAQPEKVPPATVGLPHNNLVGSRFFTPTTIVFLPSFKLHWSCNHECTTCLLSDVAAKAKNRSRAKRALYQHTERYTSTVHMARCEARQRHRLCGSLPSNCLVLVGTPAPSTMLGSPPFR